MAAQGIMNELAINVLRVYIPVHLSNTYHGKIGGFTGFEALYGRWRAISSKTASEWVNFVEGQLVMIIF